MYIIIDMSKNINDIEQIISRYKSMEILDIKLLFSSENNSSEFNIDLIKKYKTEIEKILPDYKSRREWLKKNGNKYMSRIPK